MLSDVSAFVSLSLSLALLSLLLRVSGCFFGFLFFFPLSQFDGVMKTRLFNRLTRSSDLTIGSCQVRLKLRQ